MPTATAATETLLAREAERLRRPLLGRHHYAATREDLEDIYAQSVLEVLLRVRRDPTLTSAGHIANALYQRFTSRLADHSRARAGRSPSAAAIAGAVRLGHRETMLGASTIDVEHEVIARERIREVLHALHDLPAPQRAAILADIGIATANGGGNCETQRKRCWRARRTLTARMQAA